MSLTSSQRPSPGTPFEFTPMFASRSGQSRPQHSQPPHLYTIPGTPAADPAGPSASASSSSASSIPMTPGAGPYPHPRKTPLPRDVAAPPTTSSPASGYFGFDTHAAEEPYAQNNWSAGSSLHSVAARSPQVLDLGSMPTPSENFRRQSSAIAAHNKNHAANQRSRANSSRDIGIGTVMDEYFGAAAGLQALKSPRYDSSSNSNSHSNSSSGNSRKILSPRPDGELQPRASRKETLYEEPQNYFDQPRYESPLNYDPALLPPHGRSVSVSGYSSASMTHLNGPVAGDFVRPTLDRQRSSTMPPSSQVDGLSLMYPSKLAQILDNTPKSILLLDLRPFQPYSAARIFDSVNVSIPTTLLKRPSFNIAKLTESLGGPVMKAQLARWKEVSTIIVYDAASRTVKESATAAHTVSKFSREGWQGEAYLLSGGFEDFSDLYPELVDHKPLQDETKKPGPMSLAGSSDGGPPAFNCVLPKNAANPFFSNIRQNMDLIGGVGEIALKLPPYITSEARRAMPKWMRSILKDDGAKKVADKFLKIEKAEQRRMQDALNCNVTYDSPKSMRSSKSHMLAGVEKGAKNRYNNIWPYDHTRVKLTDYSPESCDYINASYVSTEFSNKRYIATQGPIPHTFRDFWSVVWDHDVRVIVMLTAEAEGGQLKCHRYWKEHSYGPYQLNSISEKRIALDPVKTSNHLYKKDGSLRRQSSSGRYNVHDLESPKEANAPHVIMRKFTLSHSAHPFSPLREITQLQYSSWPDFGAPADPAHILALIEQTELVIRSSGGSRRASSASSPYDRRASQSVNNLERPVLVHCSAGCGRTGTFCATDSVIDMLRRQREHARMNARYSHNGGVDREGDSPMRSSYDYEGDYWLDDDRTDLIERAVENLRDQRLSMVQTLRQFVLCYETVLEWLVRRPLAEGRG
ncbi:Tyrosine-protein phosphatase [Drechslerella dactyloides]|uniref:protein-tyrosine-phosphatase n=1 Tax=Drechslerella dactyloides TaxID=74499 RepID=A0AAD6J201_DREDA|nr:Tyrosine-protein phosphatase [Drechslerella dactyloides]